MKQHIAHRNRDTEPKRGGAALERIREGGKWTSLWCAFLGALLWFVTIPDAWAQRSFMERKGVMKKTFNHTDDEEGLPVRIHPSGLVPEWPIQVSCVGIASPYGVDTRYDGSKRPMDRFGGVHGGIDLTLEAGTPLLAIAAGTVIHAGSGGIAEGNYLWLQHPPEQTGLPFWLYSKYQHLSEAPKLSIGEKVRVGQPVAVSGSSGTEGRHYGPAGYPHLHLTTIAGASERYKRQGSRVMAESMRFIDPVAIYVAGLKEVDEIENLTNDRKKVPIPCVVEGGSILPPESMVVWPVGCKPKKP